MKGVSPVKKRKTPMRKCIVTNERLPKKALIRVVRTPDGTVEIDPTGKANGRGAYLTRDRDVIEKARSARVLNRHLRCDVPDGLYDRLLGMMDDDS